MSLKIKFQVVKTQVANLANDIVAGKFTVEIIDDNQNQHSN